MKLQLGHFHFKRSHTGDAMRRWVLVRPIREWFVILFFSVMVFGIGCVYAAYVFYQGTRIALEESVPSGSESLYTHTHVREVLTEYQKKEERFAALRAQSPMPVVAEEASSTPMVAEEVPEADSEEEEVPTGTPVAQ